MPYDIGQQGYVGFSRFSQLLQQQPISRDPLSGIVNGVNKVFHTNYAPLLSSGSVAVYDALGVPIAGGTINTDTGEIVLATPPATQPVASYTFTPHTSSQILKILVGGFHEMEAWWSRGYGLVDSLGAMADESSANLFIVDGNGVDPPIGSGTFSTSWSQIGFYMACVELRYLRIMHNIKATTAYMWRETVRGMTVDQSKMPANLLAAIKAQEAAVERALDGAQGQVYGSAYGGFIAEPQTLDYAANYEWQSGSKDNENWVGYHVPFRHF